MRNRQSLDESQSMVLIDAETGENVAEEFHISREVRSFRAQSQHRAAEALGPAS